MQAVINFYNEIVKVAIPNTLTALKAIISNKFSFSKEEVDECLISSKIDGAQISKEEDYKNLLMANKNKNIEIMVQVSPNSKIYKELQSSLSKKKQIPKPMIELSNDYEYVEELKIMHESAKNAFVEIDVGVSSLEETFGSNFTAPLVDFVNCSKFFFNNKY